MRTKEEIYNKFNEYKLKDAQVCNVLGWVLKINELSVGSPIPTKNKIAVICLGINDFIAYKEQLELEGSDIYSDCKTRFHWNESEYICVSSVALTSLDKFNSYVETINAREHKKYNEIIEVLNKQLIK
jgi:hypothetical protein